MSKLAAQDYEDILQVGQLHNDVTISLMDDRMISVRYQPLTDYFQMMTTTRGFQNFCSFSQLGMLMQNCVCIPTQHWR
jgi:hypothetical protein